MSARTRRGLALSWSALFVLSMLLQYFSFALASPALAVHDEGLFELDGNALDQAPPEPDDDWDSLNHALDSIFIPSSVEKDGVDTTYFTGGGSKDVNDISQWKYSANDVAPDKDEILDAFAAVYEKDGDTFVYFGADRFDGSGDAFIGFWFLRSNVSLGANGSFNGTHVNGDILVLSDFTNGGSVAEIKVYEWIDGKLVVKATSATCDAPSEEEACAAVNGGVATAPWAFLNKSGATNFAPGEFYEGGVNLDLIFGDDPPCFSTFLAETRSSASTSAQLKDFALGSLSTCVAPTLTTDASTTTWHFGDAGVTDTASLEGNDGPASGKVKFFICSPAQITDDGCLTGGTQIGVATGVAVTTSANGGTATSTPAFVPTAAGKYCFRAEYVPDASSQYLAASHTNATTECFTVVKNDTTITTSADQSVNAGTAIADTAVLAGATADAGGTITFRAYGPSDNDCSGTPAFTSAAVAVTGNGTYGPVSFTPTAAGVYNWIATYSGDAKNEGSTHACGATGEVDTVNKVNPTIATQASATVIVGGSLTDTATVSGGHNLTGSVTFRLYGPDDATCTTVIFTSANRPLTGSTATSAAYTTTQAGTYRWIATYNGDANNNSVAGACNDPNESAVVTKANPTIATVLVGGGEAGASITVPLGTAVHDTSTLTGATANAGGTVHYQVFSDTSCETKVADAGSIAVVDHVPGNSTDVTFNHAGTFYWQADYSGDSNNNSASSACNLEVVTVDKDVPAIATQASATVQVGGAIHDTATLSGGALPTGSITFNLYGPNDQTCVGAATFTSTVSVNGNGSYESADFTTTAAGTYRWVAIYSGDLDNASVAGGCNDANENVVVNKANPTVTTNASADVTVGGSIFDTATLAGGYSPTGTITFEVYGPDDATCTGEPIFSDTSTVTGNGDYVSDSYTATQAGTYRWIANYGGDSNNTATANECNDANENVVVNKANPDIATLATEGAQVGDAIHDVATVTGGYNPTGTVTFRLYAPSDQECDGSAVFTDTVALGADGTATSGDYNVTVMGNYHWVASYSGDANNESASGACGDEGETTQVRQFNPEITTVLTSGDVSGAKITVLFGSSVTDQATLSGASATAGGTVTYTVYLDSNCTIEFADAGSKTVTNGVVPASNAVVFPDAGVYYWQASYSGDAANAAAVSPCRDEILTVTTPDLKVTKLVATGAGTFAGTSTANPGDNLNYQITISNSGSAVATNVPVSDNIAAILAHATYNDDCSNSCTIVGSTLNWTIPSIAIGGSVTLTFSVDLDATFPAGTTELPNVVVVTGPGSNCPAASEDADCDTNTTVSAAPDLNVTKLVATGAGTFAGTSTAKAGDTLNYRITISNTGNAAATNVPVSDDIAALLARATYNADCSNGCSLVGSTLNWTIASIAAGGSVTLTFSVTLDATFPAGTTTLPNVVVVTGPGSNCPEASEDADCDTTTTVSESILSIDKSVAGNTAGTDPDLNVPAANIGDTLTYTLDYSGVGPLTGAVITDVLPQGFAYIAGSGEAGATGSGFAFVGYDAGTRTLSWAAATLPDPASGTVTYRVTVLATAPEFAQPLVNVATIDSDQTPPDSDTQSIAVLAPPLDLTPPPTSTITPQSGTGNPGFALMLILLGVAGLTLGIGFITPVPARVRRRERLG
ncbi:MAG TPA: hypothetical protein VM427_03420 [Patescibacteria group bacterium]|nr:hypothetical protein [Patescibacteria group bacterium]